MIKYDIQYNSLRPEINLTSANTIYKIFLVILFDTIYKLMTLIEYNYYNTILK